MKRLESKGNSYCTGKGGVTQNQLLNKEVQQKGTRREMWGCGCRACMVYQAGSKVNVNFKEKVIQGLIEKCSKRAAKKRRGLCCPFDYWMHSWKIMSGGEKSTKLRAQS